MLNLEKYAENKNVQNKLIANMALTFRTNGKTLSTILEKDPDTIYHELASVMGDTVSGKSHSLDYLFNYDHYDQKEAYANFMGYYDKLTDILDREYNDPKKAKFVKKLTLNVIDDEYVSKLKFKGDNYTEEEVLAIIRYQLKYALSQLTIGKEFGILRNSYAKRVSRILPEHPDLKTRFDELSVYNEAMHYKHIRNR